MLVDLNKLRPSNETYEHYLLKQVGRAWLFRKGVRIIGCEVELQGVDISPFGEKKIVDVVGLQRSRKPDNNKRKMYSKIYDKAVEFAVEQCVSELGYGGKPSFISTYKMRGEAKAIAESKIEQCFRQASLHFGLHADAYKDLRGGYKEEMKIFSVESKASLSDFRNGFSVTAEYSYVISPVGVIPVELIPPTVGLLEFDFDKFHECKDWEKCLKVTKNVRKHYDNAFLTIPDKQASFNKEAHENFCRELVYTIGQEATEEATFWNPFLRNVGESSPSTDSWRYNYEIGAVTHLGIVIDRRIGEKSKKERAEEEKENAALMARGIFPSHKNNGLYTAFYKLVVPNEGITKWIPQRHIERAEINL